MTLNIGRAKRIFIGMAALAAFAVAPAMASAPVVTDAGSSWSTVRVNGSGFTPSTLVTTRQAYVQIENDDPSGSVQFVGENVTVTGPTCGALRVGCTTGGAFSYQHNMAGYQCGRRWVRAYDYAANIWSQWIQVDCA